MDNPAVSAVKRLIVSRFFASLLTIIMVAIGHYVPESAHYQMLSKGGDIGMLSSLVLLTLGVLGLLDTLINDVAPPSWCFFCDSNKRHWIWGGMAVTYAGYGFVVQKGGGHILLPCYFWAFGAFCAAIAAMDTRYEVNREGGKECTVIG